MPKTEQLQIRVSAEDKARIQRRAAAARMDVSKWVLRQVLPPVEARFQDLCETLAARPSQRAFALAELNDLLARLSARELAQAVRHPPDARLPPFEANYVAAMIAHAAAAKQSRAPRWIDDIAPLERPWFSSALKSLRLHLLTSSPPAFRSRNLFVDSSVGDRF